MKRLLYITATVVLAALSSAANAHEIEMTWTNVQDGYDSTYNFVWVTGNVTSPEAETEGGTICMAIRYQQEGEAGGQFSIGEDGAFVCAVTDPLYGSPSPILWLVLAWDTGDHWDAYGGLAN